MNKLYKTVSNVSLGLVVTLAVASCNQNANTGTTAASNDSSATVGHASEGEKIVSRNADAVAGKGGYHQDIRTKLGAKAKRAQRELQSKGQAFQREVAQHQQKAAGISPSERQATEERPARKQ